MAEKRVTAAVTRPTRTAVQGGLAWCLTELLDSFNILAMDERQYAAVLLALTLLFSGVQALVENRLGRGFLRDVPPRTEPIVDDAGHTDAVTVLAVVALVILVLALVGVIPLGR